MTSRSNNAWAAQAFVSCGLPLHSYHLSGPTPSPAEITIFLPAKSPPAPVTVRARVRLARGGAHPLEPRSLVAQWKDARLTVWGAVQMVHRHRGVIAGQLGLPEDHVRVIADVAFGG